MNPIAYLKKNGIRHAFEVFYNFKIQLIIEKAALLCNHKKALKDIIVIESHNDFDCNGGAFYQYLIDNNYNQYYRIVWLLKNKSVQKLPYNVTSVPLNKPSIRRAYYRSISKFLTSDCYLNTKLRSDQKAFFFTHGGISLKNCKGMMHIPDEIDYVLAPSENYAPIMADQMDLPFPNDKFLYLGYPVHDCLYTPSTHEVKKVTQQSYHSVVLWMPTFRIGGGHNRIDSTAEQPLGVPLIESEAQLQTLNALLAKLDCLLIIKFHPMQKKETIRVKECSNIKVLTGDTVKEMEIDNYRLMKDTDALISDYSAVAFDYLHLNRPIAYVMADREEYKLGFVVEDPHEMMAGKEILKFEDMLDFIQDTASGRDDYRQERMALFERLFQFHDGNSCKRIADFMGL